MAVAKITGETKVKVENNTNGVTYFYGEDDKKIRFLKQGEIKTVKMADLEQLMSISPSMLEMGFLYISDQAHREYLELDYSNIVYHKDIDKLLDKGAEELKEVLEKAPEAIQETVAVVAKKKKIDSKSKTKVIEEVTGKEIDEDE